MPVSRGGMRGKTASAGGVPTDGRVESQPEGADPTGAEPTAELILTQLVAGRAVDCYEPTERGE